MLLSVSLWVFMRHCLHPLFTSSFSDMKINAHNMTQQKKAVDLGCALNVTIIFND